MLKKISMIAAAGAFMMIASSAQAFTPAPLNLPVDDLAGIEQVAGGCGPGWYRGAYGRCRPMGARGPGGDRPPGGGVPQRADALRLAPSLPLI